MFEIQYQIGSFTKSERLSDRESAFARARAIWAMEGCSYVVVKADGEQIFVRRSRRTPWAPDQPDRREKRR
jgi:hypothetical protein